MNPLLQLILGGICLSFSPVFVELSDQGPAVIGFVRTGIGGLVLALLFFREISSKPTSSRLPGAMPLLMLTGVAFAADLYFWHRSIELIGGGVATVLGNSQVFYVLAMSGILFQERMGLAFWMCAGIGLVGVSLLSVSTTQATYLASRDIREISLGLAFGLMTGLCYAIFLLGMKRIQTHHGLSARSTHALVSLLCAVSLLVLDRVTGSRLPELMDATRTDWAALVALAILVHVGGWLLIATALPAVPSGLSSMLLLIQPALATIHGALFFGQRLSSAQMVGTAILLGSVAAANITHARSERARAIADSNKRDPET